MSGYPDFTKWWDKEMLLNDVFMPQYEPSTFVYTKQGIDKTSGDEITLKEARACEMKLDLQKNLKPLKCKLQLLQVTEEVNNKNCLQSINVEPKEAETFQLLKEETKKSPSTRFTGLTLPLKITNLSKQPKFEPPKDVRSEIQTMLETQDNDKKLVLLKTKDKLIAINNNDIGSVEETSNLEPLKREIKPKFYRMVAHDPTKTGKVRKQNHSQVVEDQVVPVSRHNKAHCSEFDGLDKIYQVGAGDVFGMQYPSPNYSCKRCYRSFKTRKNFYNHLSKHRMKKFECFCCFKIYVYGSGLAQHIKMEHGDGELLRKPLRCGSGHRRP